jgi:hypothetical protein
MKLYVTLAEIRRRTGVHQKRIYRLLDRVVTKADDGLIQGLRGLIPGKHLKAYTRTAAVAKSSKLDTSTAAGALQQTLDKYPAIRIWMKKEAKKRNETLRKDEIRSDRKHTGNFWTNAIRLVSPTTIGLSTRTTAGTLTLGRPRFPCMCFGGFQTPVSCPLPLCADSLETKYDQT